MITINSIMEFPASISSVFIFLVISFLWLEFSCALPSATANQGTTWINDIQYLAFVPPPLDYIGQLTVRPTLLTNNISYNGLNLQYGCGFFCYADPCETGYLFATFFVLYSSDNSNPCDLQMVWGANREKLVSNNATLELISSGNLVLKDADGTVVWSTNTSTKYFQGMKIEESGNLVLLNTSNGSLWQSFDYTSDKILLGQKFKVGQKLIANSSPTNTSPGNFYLTQLVDGFAMFIGTAPSQMYFRYQFPSKAVRLAYLQFDNESLYYYTDSSPIGISFPIPKNCLYIIFDSDGHVRYYSFLAKTGRTVTDYWLDFTNVLTICEYPRTCGDYGICTEGGQCSCPKMANAFDQIDALKPNLGCLPHSPLVCQDTATISSSPQGHQFLELEHVSYFTYFWENASTPELVSRDECKNLCLQNCSCKAAFFMYGATANFSSGHCYLESNVYSLKQNNIPTYRFYNSTAYIKYQSTPKAIKSSVIVISVAVIGGLVVFVLFILWLWWARKNKSVKGGPEDEKDKDDPDAWPAGLPVRYSFKQLQKATNDFSMKLGSGGFGSVYEGVLLDGTEIAVKCLERAGQGTKQFRTEIETLASIHHLNLVRLMGFCAEKSHRMLVYEHLPNGSLDKWIFPNETHQSVLDWRTRYKVILHIARGLTYLHEECREQIIHFDVKPQNILLDQNFDAKLSDFGLAKLVNREQSEVITMMRGTPGYMAPELLNMHVTEKADIFSFGIMVVEIVTGKKSREITEHRLISILQLKAEDGKLIDLVDAGIDAKDEAVKMLGVGMCCIQDDFTRRPAMSTVVKALEGPECFPSGSSIALNNPLLLSTESNELALSHESVSSVLSGR